MKKILSYLLLLVLMFSLCACGENTTNPTTGTQTGAPEVSNTNSDNSSTTENSGQSTPSVPNQVISYDGISGRLIVYDMDVLGDSTNLDEAEVWSFPIREKGLDGATGIKYREDTVFGDVIVAATGDGAMMFSYPEGKVLWHVSYCGENPHSIEILPSGNIVCASTNPDSQIFLFHTSQLLNGDEAASKKYEKYTFSDVHGVLWDPTEEVLWALGSNELVAYVVSGDPATEKLTRMGGMGGVLPTPYGHDLAADFTDTGYLYVTTGKAVYRFCKETNEFDAKFENHAKVSMENIKGFGNNPNGNFFFTAADGGKGTSWEGKYGASWSTATIYYCYQKTEYMFYRKACVSERDGCFYKARVFYGKYQ